MVNSKPDSQSIRRSESVSSSKSEEEVWYEMDPLSWLHSVSGDSIFSETYKITRKQIEKTIVAGGFDVVIEAGSGTGDIIGELKTDVPRIGVDLNPQFVEHCQDRYHEVDFFELNCLRLADFWKKKGFSAKYKKPLVICVNNTINIMPENIRSNIVAQLLEVAGPQGRCVVSYWCGYYFSHALKSFYKCNPSLCGKFEYNKHVDFENCTLETPTGYSTHWMYPKEVQRLLRSYDVDVPFDPHGKEFRANEDHINLSGLSIFVWFSQACTSQAKGYYDSADAQTFYSTIWGDETLHLGRYDLFTEEHKALTKAQQISKAEELHELEFVKLIQSKFGGAQGQIPKMRILDLGCGYGGLLRRLWKAGLVWHATGCDIAAKMCEKAREHNKKIGAENDIDIVEESYLGLSLPDESVDLVISMDALLHVGPEGQKTAISEASRVLRPGGWMVFCDIMEQKVVDKKEMQPIYDRIHLSQLGTPENYEAALASNGFTGFKFEPHNENVSTHYGTVHQVLQEMKDTLEVSPEFVTRMSAGLQVWKELAPKNIRWGFMSAQKTQKVTK